jgi:hypothetical protein
MAVTLQLTETPSRDAWNIGLSEMARLVGTPGPVIV